MRKAHLGAHSHDLFQKVIWFTAISLTVSKVIRSLIEFVVFLTLLHEIGLLHIFKCFNLLGFKQSRTWLNHVLPHISGIKIFLGFSGNAYFLRVHWISVNLTLRGPCTLLILQKYYLIFDLALFYNTHLFYFFYFEVLCLRFITGWEAASCPDLWVNTR